MIEQFGNQRKEEIKKIDKCSSEILAILEKYYSRKEKKITLENGEIHKTNSIGIYGNEVMTNIFEYFEIRDWYEKYNPAQQQLWWSIEKYCERKIKAVIPTMLENYKICIENKLTQRKPFEYHCDCKVFYIPHEKYKIVCYYGQSWQHIILITENSLCTRVYIREFWDKEKFASWDKEKRYLKKTSLTYFKKMEWQINKMVGFKYHDSRDIGSIAYYELFLSSHNTCETSWKSVPELGYILHHCVYTLERLNEELLGK